MEPFGEVPKRKSRDPTKGFQRGKKWDPDIGIPIGVQEREDQGSQVREPSLLFPSEVVTRTVV